MVIWSGTTMTSEYDKSMTILSISKAARRIHAQALLNLSRMTKKDWKDVTKKDVDDLVFRIMDSYADERGQGPGPRLT